MDASLNFHHLRYFWVTAREGSVTRAARKLRVTQPTVSEQINSLEVTLGEPLFRREGKRLVLTDVGRTVVRFADEIFSLGTDLLDTVRGRPTGRPVRLAVGISEAVPKVVAYRILEPALRLSGDPATTTGAMRISCQEDATERLIAQLSSHALDMVITDEPVGSTHAHAFSHLLGECGVSVFGTKKLAVEAKKTFPKSLHGAPMLLPSPGTILRREIDQWLDAREITPRVVGEFEDPALMSVFAQAGAGLFVAPDAIAPETVLAQGLRRVGSMKPLRERFYVVTVERKLVHPAVQLIAGAARKTLFSKAAREEAAPLSLRRPSRR